MIALLKGLVETSGNDWVIVDVNGVGYRAFCSARTLAPLQRGQACRLVIETHVREDHIHLYGFRNDEEHEWFLKLTAVQGVGGRVALALLSALDPAGLQSAIAAQDKASLTRADGVGPKLAARLLTELKDKVNPFTSSHAAVSGGASSSAGHDTPAPLADAVSALVNLGYPRLDAFQAVSKASANGNSDTAALIREGLQMLSSSGN